MRIAPVGWLILSIALPAAAADAPRIFVTDASSVQVSAQSLSGNPLVEANEGVSSQNLIVMNLMTILNWTVHLSLRMIVPSQR